MKKYHQVLLHSTLRGVRSDQQIMANKPESINISAHWSIMLFEGLRTRIRSNFENYRPNNFAEFWSFAQVFHVVDHVEQNAAVSLKFAFAVLFNRSCGVAQRAAAQTTC